MGPGEYHAYKTFAWQLSSENEEVVQQGIELSRFLDGPEAKSEPL
ncbi:hypothetical protein [Halobacillus litoralis]|nr:hypothetical protein [Halobacillus litoralis]